MTYLHRHSGELIAYLKKCAMIIAMGKMFDSILSKSGLTYIEDLQLCFIRHNSIQSKVYVDARNKAFERKFGKNVGDSFD